MSTENSTVQVEACESMLPVLCHGWMTRASDLGLPAKGAKRLQDLEAYMEGVVRTLVALGAMSPQRAQQFSFLASIGRLESYVKDQADAFIGKGKA